MTQYNSLNLKLSNSQLNKLKSANLRKAFANHISTYIKSTKAKLTKM